MDFTIKLYRQLLESLKNKGYLFFSVEEYCQQKADGKYVLLRHDVDVRIQHSLITAQLEAEMGIKASYYFRIKAATHQHDVIRKIASLGHEIGYHYTDLVDANGDYEKAITLFEKHIKLFRTITSVNTIAMHGSPTSRFDNRDLWKKYNYRDFDIIGEPYFDIDFTQVHYLTDTGRMWDGNRYSVRDKIVESEQLAANNQHSTTTTSTFHSTKEMVQAIEAGRFPVRVMITTHPQRWTDNLLEWLQEIALQSAKNILKRLLLGLRRYSLRC